MQYRKIFNGEAEVSRLGFGVMRVPMIQDEKQVDYDKAVPVLRRAIDLGVNIFDSHPNYCWDQSETTIGRALEGYDRSKVFISTKSMLYKELEPGETFRQRLEKSLTELRTDYIDIYLCHSFTWKQFQECGRQYLDEMSKAKEEGLVRHLGFSTHDTAENVIKLIATGEFECMLAQFNLMDQRYRGPLRHAHEKGMLTMVMGPVGGGRLVRPNEISNVLGLGDDLETVSTCFRYVLCHDFVDVAFSGMESTEQVEQNTGIVSESIEMNAEDLAKAQKIADEKQKLSDLYCTGCDYCSGCPQKVPISAVFNFQIMDQIYNVDGFGRERYRQLLEQGQGADKCVQCGECEEKCPQNIEIIRQLKEAHKNFTGEDL